MKVLIFFLLGWTAETSNLGKDKGPVRAQCLAPSPGVSGSGVGKVPVELAHEG